MIEWFALILMFIGLFFLVTAALGMVRFKDVYLRLHAVGKAATFGFAFLVMGAAISLGTPEAIAKATLAVFFQFLTAPIVGQLIGRLALRKGVKPIRGSAEG